MKTDRFEKTFTTVRSEQRTRPRWRRRVMGIVIILAISAGYLWFYAPQYLPGYLAQYRQAQIKASEAAGRTGAALCQFRPARQRVTRVGERHPVRAGG